MKTLKEAAIMPTKLSEILYSQEWADRALFKNAASVTKADLEISTSSGYHSKNNPCYNVRYVGVGYKKNIFADVSVMSCELELFKSPEPQLVFVNNLNDFGVNTADAPAKASEFCLRIEDFVALVQSQLGDGNELMVDVRRLSYGRRKGQVDYSASLAVYRRETDAEVKARHLVYEAIQEHIARDKAQAEFRKVHGKQIEKLGKERVKFSAQVSELKAALKYIKGKPAEPIKAKLAKAEEKLAAVKASIEEISSKM